MSDTPPGAPPGRQTCTRTQNLCSGRHRVQSGDESLGTRIDVQYSVAPRLVLQSPPPPGDGRLQRLHRGGRGRGLQEHHDEVRRIALSLLGERLPRDGVVQLRRGANQEVRLEPEALLRFLLQLMPRRRATWTVIAPPSCTSIRSADHSMPSSNKAHPNGRRPFDPPIRPLPGRSRSSCAFGPTGLGRGAVKRSGRSVLGAVVG